jgi:hypothetical protein
VLAVLYFSSLYTIIYFTISLWGFHHCSTLAKYSKDKTEAKKQMTMFGLNTNFPAPGEGNFGLGGFFTAPKARTDTGSHRFSSVLL